MGRFDSTVPSRSAGDSETLVVRLLVLHARQTDLVGASFGLGSHRTVIGRAPSAATSIDLDDAECSREHCELSRSNTDDGQPNFVLRDLGSRNKTYVNGAAIVESVPLASGDVVRVGSTIFLYEELPLSDCALLASSEEATPWLGTSLAARRVRRTIHTYAPLSQTVLILGESGSGKELTAKELHRQSGRKGQFLAVNCAALPEALAESELFGHRAGSFTGASSDRRGLFLEANDGTLFLDEFGELSSTLQAKLLRVLADGEVRAIGASQAQRTTARIVVATNRDLEAAIEDGRFRADLFARVAPLTLTLPALRERRDDIFPLLEGLFGVSASRFGTDAAELLLTQVLPYNTRSLAQIASQLKLTSPQGRIDLASLPEDLRPKPTEVWLRDLPIEVRVRPGRTPTESELRALLQHFRGNLAALAQAFRCDRKQVYRWLERYQIDRNALPNDTSCLDVESPAV